MSYDYQLAAIQESIDDLAHVQQTGNLIEYAKLFGKDARMGDGTVRDFIDDRIGVAPMRRSG